MIIRQTQTLIFEYPDDYTVEYEWCKTKDDRWFHKGRDTNCSIYEITTDFTITQAEQTEPQISPSDCATCKHNPWSTPRTCGKCVGQKDGKPSMYEPQTDCTTCDQIGRCERGRAVECPLTDCPWK